MDWIRGIETRIYMMRISYLIASLMLFAPNFAAGSDLDAAIQAFLVEGPDGAFYAQAKKLSPSNQGKLLAIVTVRADNTVLGRLLEAGLPIDARNELGWTPLMVALFNRRVATALFLIQKGADLGAKTPSGVTIEGLAIASGSKDVLWQIAVARGEKEATARLISSIQAGSIEDVVQALKLGTNVNARDKAGWPPLLHATVSGDVEILRTLIRAGADLNAAAPDGVTPLAAAILSGDQEIVELLLSAKADPNTKVQDMPLLTLALAAADADLAEALLKAGARPEQTSVDGLRPADLAQAMGKSDLAKKLGGSLLADVATPALIKPSGHTGGKHSDRPTGNATQPSSSIAPATAESLAEAILRRDKGEVERLLRAGVSARSRLPQNMRPLHLAVAKGDYAIIDILLQAGAKIHELPTEESALMTAVRADLSEIDRQVILGTLKQAAERNEPFVFKAKNSEGRTAFMMAVLRPVHDAVALSYLGGSDPATIDIPDRDKNRPILAAALTNQPKLVMELLRLGAKASSPDDPVSLHDIARRNGWWDVLAALPSDRHFSGFVDRNGSRDDWRKIQRDLASWGYYKGSADGNPGPATHASLKSLLKDRLSEIEKLASSTNTNWRSNRLSGMMIYSAFFMDDDPNWVLVDWGKGQKFVGFTIKKNGKIANGFGLHVTQKGEERLVLLGHRGFNDEQVLK